MDLSILLRDETAMKMDFSSKVYIEKNASNHSILHTTGLHYDLNVFNASGKIIRQKSAIDTSILDLNKVKLSKGEYRIVIKTTEGYSYCLRYLRE
jgi:hypothetical protein